jgi:hypothetical protein
VTLLSGSTNIPPCVTEILVGRNEPMRNSSSREWLLSCGLIGWFWPTGFSATQGGRLLAGARHSECCSCRRARGRLPLPKLLLNGPPQPEVSPTPRFSLHTIHVYMIHSHNHSLDLIWLDCIHSIKSIKPIKQACLLASLVSM